VRLTKQLSVIIKYWKKEVVFQVFIVVISCTGSLETKANVRPDDLSTNSYPVDLLNFKENLTRNFSPNRDLPGKTPFPGNQEQAAKPLPAEERCYIQEGFRPPADKGQDNAILVYAGYVSGKIQIPDKSSYHLPVVLISLWCAESTRIRPPPSF
jgi:hypothetical protein